MFRRLLHGTAKQNHVILVRLTGPGSFDRKFSFGLVWTKDARAPGDFAIHVHFFVDLLIL